jgi:hypothetical protein
MSADFHKILVKDDVLNVTDDIGYAVLKGAQQITPTQFTATSFSNSTHTFSCQIPSEQTLICREVLWRCTFSILLTGLINNVQDPLVQYGQAESFASFPLQRLLTSLSVQINNNTVSQNYTDILPVLIRQMDIKRLQQYGGSTPSRPDLYTNCAPRVPVIAGIPQEILNTANPQNAQNLSSDQDYMPNGAYVLNSIVQTVGTATTPATALLNITVTEPLLMSPFIWGQPESNNQAIYGVQNLNFTMQIASDPSRCFRSGSNNPQSNLIHTISLPANAFSNSQLLFKFYTPHPSSLMPSRNVIPYSEYLSFRTAPNTAVAGGASGVINSNSIQLNQVPSKIIIGVAPRYQDIVLAQPVSSDFWGDFWLQVSSISLQWNNGAGILSTAVPYDLFKFSKESGSNQSWQEFSGSTNIITLATTSFNNVITPTSGSLVMLSMAKHVQLVEDFYSSGSIGNFNLSVVVNFRNQTAVSLTPALTIYVENQGIFVTEKGSSSTFTALLNKNDVLDASMQGQPDLTSSEAVGLAGSGMGDRLLGAIGRKHQRSRMGLAGMGRSAGMSASPPSHSSLSKYLK